MDNLGDRMKLYEKFETSRKFLPLLPVYARIDGRCFSGLTRNLRRPYDEKFSQAMIDTTKFLVESTNALLGYTQSDEISLAFYSDKVDSQIFFDAKIYKMTSILASLATAKFNQVFPTNKLPVFDCRVFQLPTKIELANAFLWRELDATKNAISMAARSVYSHKELLGKTGSEMQEMLFQKGINFNDYPAFFKRGTFIRSEPHLCSMPENEYLSIPEKHRPSENVFRRNKVVELIMPPFSKVTNRVEVIFEKEKPSIKMAG